MGLLACLAVRSEATRDEGASDLSLAEAVSRTQTRAVERVWPSVVSVRALGSGKAEDEYGAGILVDRSGLVLTALHVVRESSVIGVRLSSGERYAARLIASDEQTDLGLLRISSGDEAGFKVATIGGDAGLSVGATVLVVGNPFGLSGSVSRGVISAMGRKHVVPDNVAALLQTDAAINPGSSGGVVVNLRGEVVGMVTAILTKSGGSQGVGFAVPASELRHALSFLLAGQAVRRAWIGVKVRTVGGAEPGLEVVEVTRDGPADRGGLEVGDTILRLAGVRIGSFEELRAFLRETEVGERVRIGLRRKERLLELEIEAAHLGKKT
ncbi:MAG: S1C family serine protease [Planctomycetota bacterium]